MTYRLTHTYTYTYFKKLNCSSSLAIQLLSLYTSTAGGTGLIPGQATKITRAALSSQKIKIKGEKSCFSSPRNIHTTVEMVIAAMKLKDAYSLEGKL